jgi:RNA polymerase sigma factor (sigma-70 family)
MAASQLGTVLRYVRHLSAAHAVRDISDLQLLHCFASRRDEAAFTALVRRHGRLVWGVCRHVLPHEHDAEDAFQATFLTLARKASTMHFRSSVASWLHGVAYRHALEIKRKAARRRVHEQKASTMPRTAATNDVALRELQAVLDAEVQNLPEKYRAPFVLCCLEGLSKAEAAAQLGWKEGTVSGRLAQARDRLRDRLSRRGLTLSAMLSAAALTEGAARAVPTALLAKTVRAIILLTSGQPMAAGLASAQAAVAQGYAKGKLATAVILLAGFFAGGGILAHQALVERPPEEMAVRPEQPPAPKGDPEPLRDRFGDPLPPGAVARMGTIRFRHSNWVDAVGYSPDGTFVVSGSYDRTIRFWDPTTGKELRRFTGHTSSVTGFVFTDGGKTLISSGGEGMVRVWEVSTDREVRSFQAHEGSQVSSVAVSPDGKILATGGGGNGHRTLVLWELATGKELHVLAGKEHFVQTVAFSPDRKLVASGAEGGGLYLWDVNTGKEVRALKGHTHDVTSLAFSPDGETLVSGGHDHQVRLWEVKTGKELNKWQTNADAADNEVGLVLRRGVLEPRPREGILAVAFSPNGKTVAVGNQDGALRLLDVTAGKVSVNISNNGQAVNSVAFSPDGKVLATGGWDHAVRLRDSATGKELSPLQGHDSYPHRVIVSPEGKQVASIGDNTVRLWELATGKEVRVFRGHTAWPADVAFSPDGRRLASGGWDKSVRVWDIATGKEVWKKESDDRMMAVAFSPDGKTLASASWNIEGKVSSTIRLWDAATGGETRELKEYPGAFFGTLSFTPDGKALSVKSEEALIFLDVVTGKETRRIDVRGYVSLSPDGKVLVSNTKERAARLHEAASGKVLYEFGDDPELRSRHVFSPDGKTLTWAGNDQKVRLWEVATGKVRRQFAGHQGAVLGLAFTPDGRTIVSASQDTTLLVWDVLSRDAERPANLTAKELQQRWDDLAGADAEKAFRAIGDLVAIPDKALPFLRENLKPVHAAKPERMAQLLAHLDSGEFDEREKATRELEDLAELAVPALNKALEARPSLETRRRAEALLQKLDGPVASGQRLRGVRAIEVLEYIGTPEARKLLMLLAEGADASRVTRDAKAALTRLAERSSSR